MARQKKTQQDSPTGSPTESENAASNLPGGLTAKQQAWLAHYLTHFNATAAARAAGYRCTTDESFRAVGAENLAKLNDSHIRPILKAHHLDADRVLAILSKIAGEGAQGLFKVTKRGVQVDLRQAYDSGVLQYARRITKQKGHISVELPDTIRALELIGRALGLFKDQITVNGRMEQVHVYVPDNGRNPPTTDTNQD